MLHITTTMLLILLGLAALVAFAMGSALSSAQAKAERRRQELRMQREQAKLERQQHWQKRKEAITAKLPWRRKT
jgi:hypothetical protein